MNVSLSKRISYIFKLLVIGVSYFGASYLGQLLSDLNHTASPIWPATGIAIGSLVVFGYRVFPAILIAAFAINFFKQDALAPAIGITIANIVEALLATFLLNKLRSDSNDNDGNSDSISSVIISSIASTSLAAAIGTFSLYNFDIISASLIYRVWFIWFIGDFVGAIVILPLFTQFKQSYLNLSNWIFSDVLKNIGTILASSLFTIIVFSLEDLSPLVFLLFPMLILVKRSLGEYGVKVLVVAISSICVFMSLKGQGPFESSSLTDSLIYLQFFLISFAISARFISKLENKILFKRPLIVLILGWAGSAFIFFSYQQNDKMKDLEHFEDLIEKQSKNILTSFGYYYEALEGGAGLYAASENVSLEEWQAFLARLKIIDRRPGINGLGVILITPNDKIKDFVEDQRLENSPDFEYKKVPNVSRPTGSESLSYIITFIEPLDRNKKALGLDIGSESNRRSSAELARDTGLATMSKRITLVQASKSGPGFLLYVPMYKNGATPKTVEKRKRDIEGWIYAPFITSSFLEAAKIPQASEFSIFFFEGENTKIENLLYSSATIKNNIPNLEKTTSLSLGQQKFTIGWNRTSSFKYNHSLMPSIVSLLGVLVTLLLAGHIANLETTNERAQTIADKQTVLLRENEERLKEALKNANEATRVKSEFLANMSHEIRTPMNGILGMISLMRDTGLSKQQEDLLNTMETCGDGLLTIINDILDVSKFESGKLELESVSFNLKKCLQGSIDLLKESAQKNNVDIFFSYEANNVKNVLGDSSRIRQVVVNLLSNAIKFSENGNVTLKVEEKNKGQIFFEIKDTGIGISEENQRKLFTPFSQADSSISRKFGGTGLGLVICSTLCQAMGGELRFKSTEGVGSTFFFTLNLASGEAAVGTQEKEEKVSYEGFSEKFPMRILLVEDNEINQKIAKMMLAKLGYEVAVAENGQKCLDILSTQEFDLIFMDMQMPVMDGLTATREILKEYGENRPKIVAMTANAFEEDKQRCFDAGMDDFISKPIKIDGIVRTLSGILS